LQHIVEILPTDATDLSKQIFSKENLRQSQ